MIETEFGHKCFECGKTFYTKMEPGAVFESRCPDCRPIITGDPYRYDYDEYEPEPCLSIWGHKFEPRYNLDPPKTEEFEKFGNITISEDTMRTLVRKVYVCDVCVRCGRSTR